ncbi:DNA-3-methyladenine glycosylase [Legionella moravica]|uniref:DNA-3-methyladenine glycosylase II n=1 Tax=Legionella moravica TaxID=39962 RepID=A0A378K035_9GAMM|nr:DNA-3-methyladenine glycosylase [Legionella moravica]KTD38314.1 DNA-3-methyladenine glycosylase [Legionella moravica]STX63667.1 DNA-3-methyladenine glycosylase [Legionella moravica]
MNTSFTLHPVAPYRLDYTVLVLRRRVKNCVDRWDGQYYRRVFNLDNKPFNVKVEQIDNLHTPKLLITLDEPIHRGIQEKITCLLERMLGLKRDLRPFYAMAKNDKCLNPLVSCFMGVKPPRFPTLFETLINAISCQQISLDAGLHIQNRLVEHVGMKMNHNNQVFYAFPRADEVSQCSLIELKEMGYSARKSATIRTLASALKEDQSMLSHLEEQPNDEVMELLCQFKGIGRWTAEYVLLRGLGRVDVFPGDDIGAQNNLQTLLHLENKLDYKMISEIAAPWYPYAGLIYFHLLLQKLNEKGVL